MTEHEHTPLPKLFAVRQISPRTIHFSVNGYSLFESPENVRRLMDELEAVLEGDGPQIVCEVVR
jgi:hypothetical protein